METVLALLVPFCVPNWSESHLSGMLSEANIGFMEMPVKQTENTLYGMQNGQCEMSIYQVLIKMLS